MGKNALFSLLSLKLNKKHNYHEQFFKNNVNNVRFMERPKELDSYQHSSPSNIHLLTN